MISIIIPMYNAESTILRCVRSVLSEGTEAEIVLADDGSTDGTLALAQKAAEEKDSVRVLSLPHRGVSAARNAGLSNAKGGWIMFLDADDALLPGALQALRNGCVSGTDAVWGGIVRGGEAQAAGNAVGTEYRAGRELINFALANPTEYLTIHGWAFRRNGNMPGFDPALRIGEDSDWVLRYLEKMKGKAAFVAAPVYHYTVSADSTVHSWREGQERDYLAMLRKLRGETAGNMENWPLFVLTNYLLMLTHVIFHPANPAGRKEKLKEAKRLRDDPVIAEAFAKADLSLAGPLKRIVLACLKHDMYLPAWAAVMARQAQNRKKAK